MSSKKAVSQQPPTVGDDVPEDAPPPAINDAGGGEEGKLKMIVGLLKKFMGVKDLANLRLSLPASLIEPIPNLEYWTAGDRADMLISVGDSDDPLERMLAVLRFAFTIQLKFVRGKVCKPYNSVLGEHFRCHWMVPPSTVDPKTKEPVILTHHHRPNEDDPAISGFNTPNAAGVRTPSEPDSDARSVKSLGGKSTSSNRTGGGKASMEYAASSSSTTAGGISSGPPVKVAFLCEQVSHHPPISSAYYLCPEKGIEAYGVDQISAKVSGMTVRIAPGSYNKGTFIKLNRDGPGKGEEYQISNPCANVNGLLKGSFYGTISDTITVTCRGGDGKEKYRAIVEFKDESWVSKARFLLEGVVYKYSAGDEKAENFSRIKDVPSKDVVGTLEGCWRKQINYKPKASKESRLLIDLDVLGLVPKTVRPLDSQDTYESRRFWQDVTAKMLAKSWGEATASKQAIEQAQRDKAAERKAKGEEFEPRYFTTDYQDGRARLTAAGRAALEAELAGEGY